MTKLSEERSFCRNFQIRKFPNPNHARAIRVLLVPFRFQGRVRRRTYSTEFSRKKKKKTYKLRISGAFRIPTEMNLSAGNTTRVTLLLVFFFDKKNAFDDVGR